MVPFRHLAAHRGGTRAALHQVASHRSTDRAARYRPIVCLCFKVGLRKLAAAIAGQRLTSVAAVGYALRTGINFGSCRSAIVQLLGDLRRSDAHG